VCRVARLMRRPSRLGDPCASPLSPPEPRCALKLCTKMDRFPSACQWAKLPHIHLTIELESFATACVAWATLSAAMRPSRWFG
jgi:hypothetical protein